jgi:NhaA family Na+:H+ antiporter
VIAVFYSDAVELAWLGAAAAIVAIVLVVRQLRFTFAPAFIALGALLWLALHAAGIHATIAGVVMGFLATTTRAGSGSRLESLEHTLHPWTSWLVTPVFALANAGVTLTGQSLRDAVTSPVTLGVVAGLVVGKMLGITAFAWLAYRAGVADLPTGVSWRQLAGTAALGGIGFTVSLFITALAFDDASVAAEAKVGIFVASLAAAAIAAIILRCPPARSRSTD